MKLFYTSVFALLLYFNSNAKTWNVTVANFTFNPLTINAVVGDVIQFDWGSGNHTTTCGSGLPGTSLPPGADEWDSPINSSYTSFSYTVTVPGNYLYGCSPHFSFGMQGSIVVSGALPVSFGSFTAIENKNKGLLQWKTFSEVNTQFFSIRKSTDGVKFNEIGKVNAAGNSNTPIAYEFADNDLGRTYKYLYYEIVTVDIDKKESFSVIRTIRNNGILKDNLIVALSPNPIIRPGQVQIKFNGDKTGEMGVSIYNSSGQLVQKTKVATFYGLNSGHLHICDLEKGTYNILFNLAGKKETKTVVVL